MTTFFEQQREKTTGIVRRGKLQAWSPNLKYLYNAQNAGANIRQNSFASKELINKLKRLRSL